MTNVSQYTHPEWAEKKRKVFARDKCCQVCSQDKGRMDVHHKTYLPYGKIYDSPIDDLVLLCASCHERVGGLMKRFRYLILGLFWRPEHLLPMIESLDYCINNNKSGRLRDGLMIEAQLANDKEFNPDYYLAADYLNIDENELF